MTGTFRRCTSSSGQASVEFAFVLPLVVIMACGLVAVGMTIRDELAVELAAREGARAASVSANPASAATAAASRAITLPIEVAVEVATATDSSAVTVTVTATQAVHIAFLGSILGPVTHTASVTMTLEPP